MQDEALQSIRFLELEGAPGTKERRHQHQRLIIAFLRLESRINQSINRPTGQLGGQGSGLAPSSLVPSSPSGEWKGDRTNKAPNDTSGLVALSPEPILCMDFGWIWTTPVLPKNLPLFQGLSRINGDFAGSP